MSSSKLNVYILIDDLSRFDRKIQDSINPFVFNELVEFRKTLQLKTPHFIVILDSLFSKELLDELKEIPIIVMSREPDYKVGLQLVREGVLDYIDYNEPQFYSKLVDRYLKLSKTNRGGFLHRLLRESEHFFHSIVHSTDIHLLVCNQSFQIVLANDKANSTFGLIEEAETNVGDIFDSILKDDVLMAIARVFNGGPTQRLKCSRHERFDKPLPLSWKISSIKDDPDHVVLYGEDITAMEDKRRNESYVNKTLIAMNNRLTQTNSSLEKFSSMVAHDLKNGLGRIQGFSKLMIRKESETLTEQGGDFLDRIIRNTDEMVETIDGILEFSRAKGAKISVAEIPILSKIKEVMKGFDLQLEKIEGRVNYYGEDHSIEADAVCMKQVIENLVSNAIKYRSEERNLEISIKTDDMGSDIYIEISDNGIGVDDHSLESLFDQFYRIESAKDMVDGHGIGLSTVKTLIMAHGGVIWAEKGKLNGCVFKIQLPKIQEKG